MPMTVRHDAKGLMHHVPRGNSGVMGPLPVVPTVATCLESAGRHVVSRFRASLGFPDRCRGYEYEVKAGRGYSFGEKYR